MTIAYSETKRNARLTSFDGIRDVVIANAVKNVPEIKREKAKGSNKSLREFS